MGASTSRLMRIIKIFEKGYLNILYIINNNKSALSNDQVTMFVRNSSCSEPANSFQKICTELFISQSRPEKSLGIK